MDVDVEVDEAVEIWRENGGLGEDKRSNLYLRSVDHLAKGI
jgi:hypothetical protein